MNISQGSLVIVGANTPDCKVFWNGQEVLGVTSLRIDMDTDEQRVALKLRPCESDADRLRNGEMRIAGIRVKEERL